MVDEILTAEQVAELLKVHRFTVLKFIKQGKLKASKLGRVYRIRRSEVDRFLDSQISDKAEKQGSGEKEKRKGGNRKLPSDTQPDRREKKTQKIMPREATAEAQKRAPRPTEAAIGEKSESGIKEEKGNQQNEEDHYILKISDKNDF